MSIKRHVTQRLPREDVEAFRYHPHFLTYARLARGNDSFALWLYEVDAALTRRYDVDRVALLPRMKADFQAGIKPPDMAERLREELGNPRPPITAWLAEVEHYLTYFDLTVAQLDYSWGDVYRAGRSPQWAACNAAVNGVRR